MPKWLQTKIKKEEIVFVIGEEGDLSVQCLENISKDTRDRAVKRIYDYMEQNTCSALSTMEVQ